ncbi:MAG: class I SAM-dependent methyltransferase [Gammaproteobacteria bacterium]|nr:class I SAM-dependent methyltransferase [Gammaproteobacteria bacterium]
MERRPEPELMDSEAQTAAYAAADFNESNSLFTRLFAESFPDCAGSGAMIDLGCGPGDIALRMARAYPGWRITGLDAGENMLRRARERFRSEGEALDVTFKHGYLPDDSLEEAAWDALISNSLLHHLPDPLVLWHSIRRLARPGAAVLVMDLCRPAGMAEAQALVDHYAADEPPVLRDDFYNSLLAAYTLDEVRDQLEKSGLAALSAGMCSDRHWFVQGRITD